MRVLDLDAVQAFVLVADHGSFTRAADALGATQSGISLRLKRLEDRLGARLFERTPRLVRLTPQGEAFLPRARRLLEAQDDAVAAVSARPPRLVLGISDHVAGPELPGLLARVAGQGPGLALEVRLDLVAGPAPGIRRRVTRRGDRPPRCRPTRRRGAVPR